ncbi:hypothetical protein ACJX0J_005660 [Zea mays]
MKNCHGIKRYHLTAAGYITKTGDVIPDNLFFPRLCARKRKGQSKLGGSIYLYTEKKEMAFPSRSLAFLSEYLLDSNSPIYPIQINYTLANVTKHSDGSKPIDSVAQFLITRKSHVSIYQQIMYLLCFIIFLSIWLGNDLNLDEILKYTCLLSLIEKGEKEKEKRIRNTFSTSHAAQLMMDDWSQDIEETEAP